MQRYLDALPYNTEPRGDTMRSFRRVLEAGTAHCLEGALFAAAVLEQHGHPPVLLDLESADGLDHVVLLHRARRNGSFRYGSVAVSRDPGLHGRKPVYRSVGELARSYHDPYIDATGRITGYAVFDLRDFAGADWRFSTRFVWEVEQALIDLPHRPLRVPRARYRRWKRRYDAWVAAHPDVKPAYYPSRPNWL